MAASRGIFGNAVLTRDRDHLDEDDRDEDGDIPEVSPPGPPEKTVSKKVARRLLGDGLTSLGSGELTAIGPLMDRLCEARLLGQISSKQARDLASLIRSAIGLVKPLRDERAVRELKDLVAASNRALDDARRERAAVGPPPGTGPDGRAKLRSIG